MKKALSIITAIALIITVITGCGNKETESPAAESGALAAESGASAAEVEGQVAGIEVTLPVATGTRAMVEGEAVITTQLYLLARAYFEKLETYDMNSFDAKEYSDLLSRALEAFRIAEAFSVSLESHASTLAQIEEKGTSEQEKASYVQLSMKKEKTGYSPFVMVAYAADKKSAAVKYAEDLTKTFDDAKSGQKLKAVAEKYGTDVKKAKVMLEQAQSILEGAAYEDQAAFENKCYELAVETKSACSTTVFVLSCITSSGLTAAGSASVGGIVEAGGVAFNGVSAIIDLGTAATIHTTNGEGNEYTAAWDKTAELVAPVAAVFSIAGGIQNYTDFKDPTKVLEKYDNLAQACLTGVGTARDYIQDGTVLGVSANIIDGYKKVFAYSAQAGTKAAEEALIKSGVSEEALTAKPGESALQQSQEGTGLEAYIEAMGSLTDPSDPLNVEAILGTVDTAFRDCAAQEGVEAPVLDITQIASSTAEEAADVEEAEAGSETAGNAPAISKVAGSYTFQGEGDPWIQIVTVVDDTHLQFLDAEDPEAVIVGTYDEDTGVFSYSETSEDFTSSVKVTFTDTGSGIRANLVLTLSNESGSMDAYATAVKE